MADAPEYMPDSARRSLVASPSGACGHQPARVDRPERYAGANRRQLMVARNCAWLFDAVQPQAAGEIDQRLLLVQLPEHLDGGLQRGQLAVGVEDVELAVVLAERRAGVGALASLPVSSKPWPSPDDQRLRECSAVGRGRR